MKIKRLYLLGIGLMFTSQFLTSCHDLLEKDPTDSYSETVAWSSESSLDMYVTYLYKPLNGLSNFSSLSLTDGYTDLVKYGNGVPQTWSAHNKILLQQNTITSDNNPMSSWGLYTDIFRENVFLRDAGIYGSKFNEDFLNTRIAEIRFIRAVNYARMIRIFGGVILRDETNGVDSEGEKAKARATEAESWDFVLKDLEFAAKHLPKEWGISGILYAMEKIISLLPATLNTSLYSSIKSYLLSFLISSAAVIAISQRFAKSAVRHI